MASSLNKIQESEGTEVPLSFLDSVIEALPDMVFIKDARTLRFVRFNRAGEELLGYSRADMIGKSDYDFFPKEQADHFVAFDRKVLVGRKVVEIAEEPVLTRNRGTRFLHTKKIPLFARDGRPAFLVGLSEDITDRKQEQKRQNDFLAGVSPLLTSSLDYRVTLRSLARLAVPTLADWCTVTIVRENGSLERLAAFHRDESKASLIAQLLGYNRPESGARIIEIIRTGRSQLLTDISEYQSDCEARHLNLLEALGSRSALMVPIPGRQRVHGVITLVSGDSGRKFLQEDLSLAEEFGRRAGVAVENALLYEAARSAIRSRDEFLSIASHELKTPLTTLKLHAEMTRRRIRERSDRGLDEKSILGLLETTDRQVDRLVRLVDDLLDITRIASGKLSIRAEEVDLGSLAREVLDRFDAQFRSAGCQCRLEREKGVVGHWDRYRIEQVLTNLITNAIKYGARAPIDIFVICEEDQAVVRVRDHGIGIAPADLSKIFHRFERAAAPRDVGGLGLGLYICRQIVEAHGGSIHVASAVGEGSTFTVKLPVH